MYSPPMLVKPPRGEPAYDEAVFVAHLLHRTRAAHNQLPPGSRRPPG